MIASKYIEKIRKLFNTVDTSTRDLVGDNESQQKMLKIF